MVNWEFYWNMTGYAVSVAGIGTTGFFFHRFVKPFLPEARHTVLIGITYAIVMLVLKLPFREIDSMAAYAAGIVQALAVMYLIDKKNLGQKIFLAVTWYLLEWIAWGMIIFPWSILYQKTILCPYMMKHPFLQFGIFVVVEILYVVMDCLVLVSATRIIHKAYGCKKENMTGRELALIIAPFLSVMAGYGIIHFFSRTYEADTRQAIWDSHFAYNWLLVLYVVISFFAMLTAVVSYQHIKNTRREEKEDAVLSRQIEDMKRHIHEVEKLYFDIRSLKHDMGNHVMVLENLYGGDEKAGEYITGLKEWVNDVAMDIKSGNPVTDVILREKKKEAEDSGIDFRHEFCYPGSEAVSAFDVSVILSNALGNAIEAAKECEAPYISIKSYCRKNAYMIEIRNSVAGMRTVDRESGLPVSSGKEEGHGFGLANIRKVAQRYYGDIDITQDGKEFVLSIMLMTG